MIANTFSLQLAAVAQVTGITETWHNILVVVQAWINGCTPDSCLFLGESLLDMLYSLWCRNDTSYMDTLWSALGKECLVAQFHTASCRQHRGSYNNVLSLNAWRRKILYMHTHPMTLLVCLFTISRNESVAGMIENIKKSIMERKTCTENCGEHNLVCRHVDRRYT